MTKHPLTRRDFLRAGALAAGALTLPRLPGARRRRRQTPPELPVPLDTLAPDREVLALPTEDIERVMADGLTEHFPAAQVMVCREREVFWYRAYGEATLTARFDLASLSKLFTTTVFLSLVGEGRVALSTPLAFVEPLFVAVGVDEQGRRSVGETQDPRTWELIAPEVTHASEMVDPAHVTFRHLLTHTSGLAPWRSVFMETGPTPPPEGIAGRETRARRQALAVRAISTYPFAGPPDSGIRYSDLGFIMLGAATAHLHGGLLDDAIYERVLAPLGLEATTFNPVLAGVPTAQIVPTEFDERWRNRRLHGESDDRNAAGLGGVAGHAGLFSTARDLVIFGQAWLEGITTGQGGALSVPVDLMQEAVRQQATNGRVRWGFGWALQSAGYARVGARMSDATFGHTGYTGTSLFIDPTRALIVVCLTNRVYNGRDGDLMAFWPVLHDTIVETMDRLV